MDKILLHNMAFYGYHGAISEENKLGQRFYVDATLYLSLQKAGKTDNLLETVHYGEVYSRIKGIVEGAPFKLLEALAEKISFSLLEDFPLIEEVKIQVRKPEVPIPGILDYAAVEIRRKRDV